jgi:hypothetical protein
MKAAPLAEKFVKGRLRRQIRILLVLSYGR